MVTMNSYKNALYAGLLICFSLQLNTQTPGAIFTSSNHPPEITITNCSIANSDKLEFSPAFYHNGLVFVSSRSEKGGVDKSLKIILSENNWAKYKHLFASSLSSDDFAAFNRFFDACVDITDARRRMWEVFNANLTAKASFAQQKILSIKNLLSPEGQAERNQIIAEINGEVFVFDPQEPKDKIFQSLQLMGRLSNTVAFEKLKKIAGIHA